MGWTKVANIKGRDSTVPGPAPATSWQGTALVVDGKVGPDLKGTKGDAGKDSTVPGPPNVLSIGTVTTGAPGSQAAAQIKGTAPSQSLDLTIPTGKAATPPAFTASATALAATAQPTASISGTHPNLTLTLGIPAGGDGGGGGTITAVGRPDAASTMDSDTRVRVAAATSGTLFSSNDRPQGATLWQKQGTTWVVIAGETEVRVAVGPNWLTLRRINGTVFALFALEADVPKPSQYNGVIPAGFRPAMSRWDGSLSVGTSTWRGVVNRRTGDFRLLSYDAVADGLASVYAVTSWPTTDPWTANSPS